MTDPLFRAFLVSQAEALRADLTDATLEVPTIIEKAKQILQLESRIKRMDNPVFRTKKAA